MARLYVPVSLTLPYGYRIRVRLVTDSEMLRALDEEDNKAVLVDGLWDSEARLIQIRKSLPKARQISVFAHELHHALADWQHYIADTMNLQP